MRDNNQEEREDTIDFRPQLALAKQFFMNAGDANATGGRINRMIAIHNLHIATEIVLKAAAARYEATLPKDSNIEYSTLVSTLARSDELKRENVKIYYKQQLIDLNSQRNLVQHSAFDPGENAVIDHIRNTNRFMKKAFEKYFETEFDDFYESSLVDSEVCRLRLKAAELHLGRGEYFKAAGFAHAAFDWARKCLPTQESNYSMNGEWVDVRYVKTNTTSEDLKFFLRQFDKQNKQIKNQQHALLAVVCGLEPHKYLKFDKITPHVNYTMGGDVHIWDGDHRRDKIELNNADYAIRFAVEAILRWQSLGYDLAGTRSVDSATAYIQNYISNLSHSDIEE